MRDLNSSLSTILFDIKAFVSMFTIFVMGFANVFYAMDFYQGNQDKSNVWWYFFYTYDMFYANWEWGSPPDEDLLWPGNIIFVIFVILFPIIMFNLLIALVVGSYQRHMENLLNDDNKRKMNMIIDVIEMKLILNRLRDKWCCKKAPVVESEDIHDEVDQSEDEVLTPDSSDVGKGKHQEEDLVIEYQDKKDGDGYSDSFGTKLFNTLDSSVFVYLVFERDEAVEIDKWQWRDQIFSKVARIDVLEKKVGTLKQVEAKVKKLDFQMEMLMKLITKKKKKRGKDSEDEDTEN